MLGLFFLQESKSCSQFICQSLVSFIFSAFAPILLERKAARIRKEMSEDPEKGSPREVRTVFENADRRWQQIVSKALVRPFKLFFSEPIVQLFGAYMAFVYGTMYREYYSTQTGAHL